MAEIKVGDYIRYNDGTIIKVIEEEHSYYNYLFKNKKGIFKHSPNIIDLIEEGDYVRGKLVSNVDKVEGRNFIEWENGDMYSTEIPNDKFIENIVTKEQFEQMKYVVGDESNE